MRLLHTSDWHVGKPLRNQRRDAEYASALAEVLDVARDFEVDCLLVAGDMFDSFVPSPEAEEIVFDFFRGLVSLKIPAVIAAGNHDHPRRLNAIARILEVLDIHVRADTVRPDEGGIVQIRSRKNQELASIAVLPWVSERKAREWVSLEKGGDKPFKDYAEDVARRIEELSSYLPAGTIKLLVGHVMVDGGVVREGGGERALHITEVYALNPHRFPPDLQYLALGHLHRRQEVVPRRGYYSGSLIQLDFGETEQEKSVNIIDVAPNQPVKMQRIAINAGRQLKNLGSHKGGLTLDEIRTAAESVGDAYVKVFVKADRPVPGLAQEVRDLLPNAVDIVVEHTARVGEEPPIEFGRQTPVELFTAYYGDLHSGAEPPPELMSLFNRLYEEVTGAAH